MAKGERRKAGTRRSGFVVALAFVLAACARPHDSKPAPVLPRSTEVIRREGNHLVGQASPYLLQHSHNPVDWYPWGDEALALARNERRLVFLSIGYATCHWCHVMEKESFEDDSTARYLNEHFVAIKVDREQRPDLDALFLEAVTRMGGSTGWPLTVVLSPDLEPLFGGTYFPKTSGGGRLSLTDALREVEEQWKKDGPDLVRRGRELLAQIDKRGRDASDPDDISEDVIRRAFKGLERSRDTTYGGFGSHQKFPTSPLLLAELRFAERTGDPPAQAHVTMTLEKMMRGGIHDVVAGSFHRYATDRTWHVPHFERMLYDNAQLATLYLEAGHALGRADFLETGRAVLEDLAAAWQTQDGGLVVGFDADDPKGEGVYSTWTAAELDAALGPADGRVFATTFGVTREGERALGGRSVLHRTSDDAAAAASLGIDVPQLQASLARARPLLRAVRDARPAPAVDDKELASWNGLALMAFADAARWLDDPRFLAAAQKTARFLVGQCWQTADKTMRRGLRRGVSLGDGFLDDYALAALGLMRLHAADGDLAWLEAAHALANAIGERFWDETRGAFMSTGPLGPTVLPLRRPDEDDGVLPSGGAAATLLFLELGALGGDATLERRGLRALRVAASRLAAEPFGSGFALVAADHATSGVREVVIAGAPDDPRTRALAHEIAWTTDARILIARLPAAGVPERMASSFPALAGKMAISGKPTAFVCKHGACEAPTSDPAALHRSLAP